MLGICSKEELDEEEEEDEELLVSDPEEVSLTGRFLPRYFEYRIY